MSAAFDRFVAIDVETTGLEKNASIIEIALVSVNGGKIVDRFQSFVRPPQAIPRDITQLTGITNRMVEEAPDWKDIEPEVRRFIDGRLLVAHNTNFDRGRLEFELGETLPNRWLDTHDLAKLLLPNLTSYKLSAIASHLNISDPAHHRAMNDALVCAHVALRLVQMAQRTDPFVLSQMAALFKEDDSVEGDILKTFAMASGLWETPKPEESFDTTPWDDTPCLNFHEASQFFAPDGVLSNGHDAYEVRPQQKEMLQTIMEAFETERHAIIEAGTGTGKTFAYLLPALLWGYENDCRVIVSTATITLQERIYHQDIPFLSRLLRHPFRATIVKGRNNYLCLRRFTSLVRQSQNFSKNERLFYASLFYWLGHDTSGDRERLNLNKMEHQFWQNIAATADTCFGGRCPHYNECYYFACRNQAEKSQLLIVNHSLLLQNARRDGGVLPQFSHLIIDEAHHLEDEASRQFTDELDFELIRKNLNGLARSGGLLRRIQSQVAKSDDISLDPADIDRLLSEAQSAANEAALLFEDAINIAINIKELDHIGERRITKKIRQSEWWQNYAKQLETLLSQLHQNITLMTKLQRRIQDAPDLEAVARELNFTNETLKNGATLLEIFISPDDPEMVYWVKTQRTGWGNNVSFYLAQIDIMPLLKEQLFDQKKSVVLTSATLAINHNLDYTAQKYLLEEEQYLARICTSPFDHAKQSIVAIPTNHPDYSSVSDYQYTQNVANDLKALIPATDGDMLVLFTSYAMLNKVYFILKKDRNLKDYTILGHGQDGSRTSIIETMQKNRRTVVLGAASFWEGVDVPGKHLRTVVIAKLPFAPPSQPLESARAEKLEAQGKNAFQHLSLPQAILRFRQGAGRLLRTQQDWGAIVILDNRIITKNYGKQFIQSLDTQPLLQADTETLALELAHFMKKQEQ